MRAWCYATCAQQLRIAWVNSEDDLKRINQNIALLDQGHAFDQTWGPIGIGLADAYANRGLYVGKQNHLSEAIVDFDPIRADPRFMALVGDASAE